MKKKYYKRRRPHSGQFKKGQENWTNTQQHNTFSPHCDEDKEQQQQQQQQQQQTENVLRKKEIPGGRYVTKISEVVSHGVAKTVISMGLRHTPCTSTTADSTPSSSVVTASTAESSEAPSTSSAALEERSTVASSFLLPSSSSSLSDQSLPKSASVHQSSPRRILRRPEQEELYAEKVAASKVLLTQSVLRPKKKETEKKNVRKPQFI